MVRDTTNAIVNEELILSDQPKMLERSTEGQPFMKLELTSSCLSKRRKNLHSYDIIIGDQVSGTEVHQTVVSNNGNIENRVIRKVTFEHSIDFLGDQFILLKDKEGCFLTHKEWSLMGEGKNLEEAKKDLVRNIMELRDTYLHTPIENLDFRAVQFRNFLSDILTV